MSSPSMLNAKIVNLALVLLMAGGGFFAFTKYNEFVRNSNELSSQESVLKNLQAKQENVRKLNLPADKVAKKNYEAMVNFLKTAGLSEISDQKDSTIEEWGLKSKSLTVKVQYDKLVEVLGLAKQQGWVIAKVSKKEQFAFVTLSVTVQGDK